MLKVKFDYTVGDKPSVGMTFTHIYEEIKSNKYVRVAESSEVKGRGNDQTMMESRHERKN